MKILQGARRPEKDSEERMPFEGFHFTEAEKAIIEEARHWACLDRDVRKDTYRLLYESSEKLGLNEAVQSAEKAAHSKSRSSDDEAYMLPDAKLMHADPDYIDHDGVDSKEDAGEDDYSRDRMYMLAKALGRPIVDDADELVTESEDKKEKLKARAEKVKEKIGEYYASQGREDKHAEKKKEKAGEEVIKKETKESVAATKLEQLKESILKMPLAERRQALARLKAAREQGLI